MKAVGSENTMAPRAPRLTPGSSRGRDSFPKDSPSRATPLCCERRLRYGWQIQRHSGKVNNANFITGAGLPTALALSGNRLFGLDATGPVREYNATTGAAINANLITQLSAPSGLAAQGNTLFVANSGSSTVGKYDATTGEAINANFITGAGRPTALTLLDHTLFAASQSGTVRKYDANTGESINTSFITGLQSPTGLALTNAQ